MAIGTITSVANAGYVPSQPLCVDLLSFAGDGAYPTGGTASFQASVRSKLGKTVTILAVVGQDCGGYVPVYDKTNDKLKVYYSNDDGGADGPLIEVADTTNLSGSTFNVIVLST